MSISIRSQIKGRRRRAPPTFNLGFLYGCM